MITRDISFQTPVENILFDEVLLSLAEKGKAQETLRFWESEQTFVVLGKTCDLDQDVKVENVLKDKIPVLRRFSGGGTVVQGRGCLNYSLILSKEKNPILNDLRKSYQYVLAKMMDALNRLNIDTEFYPISDLALKVNNKKFSGNAQHRGKRFILHHGTILYDFDLQKISQYLKMPQDMPEYRVKRRHGDFIANIKIDKREAKSIISQVFASEMGSGVLSEIERSCLNDFLISKSVIVDLSD